VISISKNFVLPFDMQLGNAAGNKNVASCLSNEKEKKL